MVYKSPIEYIFNVAWEQNGLRAKVSLYRVNIRLGH